MTENVHYRLIVRSGPDPNKTFELNGNQITLGRDIINDITISDPEVSRQHCQFIKTDDGYTIEDLNSTNGTFVNGKKLTGTQALKRGDRIGFGETVLVNYSVTEMPGPGQQPAEIKRPVLLSSAMEETQKGTASPEKKSTVQAARVEVDEATSSTPPTPAAPPAYMAAPPEVEPALEANRIVLLGCVGVVTLCIVVGLAAVILVDSSERWNDVPIVGRIFERAPVPMDTVETPDLEVRIPTDWAYATIYFEDLSAVITSPNRVDYVMLPEDYTYSFDDGIGAIVVQVNNQAMLPITEFQTRMLTENGLNTGLAEVVEDSIEIDGQSGTLYQVTAPRVSDLEDVVEMRIATIEHNGKTLLVAMVSPEENGNREIFDYMMDTLQFSSGD